MKPVKLITIYLVVTLVLFFFGPFAWELGANGLLFLILNISYIMAFLIGWYSIKDKRNIHDRVWTEEQDEILIKKIGFLCFINIFFLFINIFRSFHFPSFDIKEMVNRIRLAFLDMGEAYKSVTDETVSRSQVVGGSFFSFLNFIWDFFNFTIILLTIRYFFKLKLKVKILALCNYFLVFIQYFSMGTNIGIFRLLLAIIVFLYIWSIKKHKMKLFICLAFVGLVLFAFIFYFFISARISSELNFTEYSVAQYGINVKSPFWRIIPKQLQKFFVILCSYLCQGYQGMVLSLQVEWQPMFGIGNSRAILNTMSDLFNVNFFDYTYQHKLMVMGWHETVRWHTFYMWIANDFSYYGCIFIMFLYGVLFSICYKDVINKNNPFAYLMLYYMFLIGIFIPCNNQVFQTMEIMLSFIGTFICWLFTRKKKPIHIVK